MKLQIQKVSLIGFGEAGGIFAAELASRGCSVTTFDILIRDVAERTALEKKAALAKVSLSESLGEAVRSAELVISAVTASAAQAVASECGALLGAGQYFLDINSISPHAKRANEAELNKSGAIYVEAAVMAPVPPQRLRVPILLGGQRATELNEALLGLGFNTKVVAPDVGVASAIKMCRSVMIKGLEALAVECLFSARRYGAEDAVLASLHATFPTLGWDARFPDYLISRVAEHGRRRAAEMREVAETLKGVGIIPSMAEATAERQEALVDEMKARDCLFNADESFSWRDLADKLR